MDLTPKEIEGIMDELSIICSKLDGRDFPSDYRDKIDEIYNNLGKAVMLLGEIEGIIWDREE